jgi:hypothetical protein
VRNHLFIGLGGQGGRTLAELKKVMAQREKDAERLKESGVNWQFLGIDSSEDVKKELKCWKYFGEDLSLGQNDWLLLAPITSVEVDVLALRPDVAPWIGNRQQIKDFVDSNKIEGANQRRRFGRLLFAHGADQIRTALFNQKVTSLIAAAHKQCVFHIFASLAGGTGSGCIVDLITTIRAKYPESDLNAFPIFVYVYATHDDGSEADVGYFYQNQFAALRDLNALICDKTSPPITLNLLGTQVAGSFYAGSEPIAQLVITTSLNLNNIGIPLQVQIRMVAESCFERISAWATGQMSANSQRSITGQDIVANFPGEPLRKPERSYRFAGFGMRRWEVPHQKVQELLALDLLSSSLRQMLFANWEHNRGFADSLPTLSDEVSATCLDHLDKIIEDYLLSGARAADLARRLRVDIKGLAEGVLKEPDGELDLGDLESRVRSFYEKAFLVDGAIAFFQTERRNQPAKIDSAIFDLDRMLTGFWLEAANPVAIAHLLVLLESLATTLRAKLQNRLDLSAAGLRLSKVSTARRIEWTKITMLSASVGKRRDLFLAHANDAATLHAHTLQRTAEETDMAFLNGILAKINQLKIGYTHAQGVLSKLLTETVGEHKEINTELEGMRSGEGANKYEFESEALAKFLQAMRTHLAHQRDSAQAMRTSIGELLDGRRLTSLKGHTVDFIDDLAEKLRQTAMDRANGIHQALEQDGEAPRILEDSLLRVLENRFAGNATDLQSEVSAFVGRAASCLHLKGGAQPATLLGRNLGVPAMPRRILLLGLPNDNAAFANKLKTAFINAKSAGTNLVHDTYTHDDPTQLRLLFVDYWLAARFTTVAHELATAYAANEGDTAYFCNLDAAGEQGKRPPLFLPKPEEMRSRYKAELWLARQNEIRVVRVDQNGVCLIREGQLDGSEVMLLGPDLGRVEETANEESTFVLHQTLSDAVQALPGDHRQMVTGLIQKETDRIKETHGITSPEYRNWTALRCHLQGFTL